MKQLIKQQQVYNHQKIKRQLIIAALFFVYQLVTLQ